jgi:hypothetical protein
MPKNFVRITEENKCLCRGRRRLADSNMKLKEIGCENVDYLFGSGHNSLARYFEKCMKLWFRESGALT